MRIKKISFGIEGVDVVHRIILWKSVMGDRTMSDA